MTPEQRFAALGLELPPAPKPMGVYKPALIEGSYLYVSGHGTMRADGSMIVGKVGQDLDADAAKLAARQVGLSMIATIRATLGSLDRIHHVVKVLGMVWAVPEFDRHPFVINGCSELFAGIWGEDRGVGVRSAVGMGSLPGNIPVEIEALFKLEDA
jgi:enamine deaminase RidA (YjgF/YER057c/UK114 family)